MSRKQPLHTDYQQSGYGVEVHAMTMCAKVRRLRFRDGLTISEIACRTSVARNTVKGWLRGPVLSEMAEGFLGRCARVTAFARA